MTTKGVYKAIMRDRRCSKLKLVIAVYLSNVFFTVNPIKNMI